MGGRGDVFAGVGTKKHGPCRAFPSSCASALLASDVAEDVGLEPTKPLAELQFSKLLPYHSAQPSMFFAFLS